MARYSYVGPVMAFGVCVNPKWMGETTAPTKDKAKCNLTYQYKRQTGRSVNAKIRLTGKITKVGSD